MRRDISFDISMLVDLYDFLLVGRSTIPQIRERFGIGSNTTVYRYFDLIRIIYNVSVVTKRGNGGGTYIENADKNRVILSYDEQEALCAILEDKTQKLSVRKAMFSVLFRLGNPKEVMEVLNRNRYILVLEGEETEP